MSKIDKIRALHDDIAAGRIRVAPLEKLWGGEAWRYGHMADAASYAMVGVDFAVTAPATTRIEVTRDATHVLRCAKCEGESSGTARDAGKRCACGGSLSLCRKLEPEPQRPTYRIPAREVVPGMLLHGAVVEHVWTKTTRGDVQIQVHRGGVFHYPVHDTVNIQLRGPSPRELACTCKPGMGRGPGSAEQAMKHAVVHAPDATVIEDTLRPWRCAPAAEHLPGCPVAPVPDGHGGMRIWPAPFKGKTWQWNGLSWESDLVVSPASVTRLSDRPQGWSDMVLQCFYLPPEPQEERREPTPWAPHAGYEALAVRYG